MKYIVFEDNDFSNEYYKAFQEQNLETEAAKQQFRDEVFTVQGAVEDALKAKWDKADDFEVGWDFNYCSHTCCGIYSERIFCKDYVETIGNVLRSVDAEGSWTYHTVCEITINPDAKTSGESMEDRGELFVRGDTCYVIGSAMMAGWRARIGCPERTKPLACKPLNAGGQSCDFSTSTPSFTVTCCSGSFAPARRFNSNVTPIPNYS